MIHSIDNKEALLFQATDEKDFRTKEDKQLGSFMQVYNECA